MRVYLPSFVYLVVVNVYSYLFMDILCSHHFYIRLILSINFFYEETKFPIAI